MNNTTDTTEEKQFYTWVDEEGWTRYSSVFKSDDHPNLKDVKYFSKAWEAKQHADKENMLHINRPYDGK